MRLTQEISSFWKNEISQILPDAKLYLFGSRVNDEEKGGDIDLMVIGSRKLDWEEVNKIKWEFYSQFGEQKLDLLSFRFDENNNFKNIALSTGILL